MIYWFGFVETLLQANDKRFIIRDHFPRNNIMHIVKPDLINDGTTKME